jgi:hypothetical protein
MKSVVIACLCGVALAAVGCADGRGVPTSPGVTTEAASLSASPRSGELHVTKECSGYTGEAGSFCTIESSNVKAIEVDSVILYLQPDQLGTVAGSDVVLDPPGSGNNQAFGNCSLARGECTFSGGTGKFTGFQARVVVTANDDFSLWFWDSINTIPLIAIPKTGRLRPCRHFAVKGRNQTIFFRCPGIPSTSSSRWPTAIAMATPSFKTSLNGRADAFD